MVFDVFLFAEYESAFGIRSNQSVLRNMLKVFRNLKKFKLTHEYKCHMVFHAFFVLKTNLLSELFRKLKKTEKFEIVVLEQVIYGFDVFLCAKEESAIRNFEKTKEFDIDVSVRVT